MLSDPPRVSCKHSLVSGHATSWGLLIFNNQLTKLLLIVSFLENVLALYCFDEKKKKNTMTNTAHLSGLTVSGLESLMV